MAEDEEIDIVGEFSGLTNREREISNLSSGQILSCEYTVHPRWLLDNPGDFANDGSQNSQENNAVIVNEITIELEHCDEVTANENLIPEKDIPDIICEEEVVSRDDETYFDSPNNDQLQQQFQFINPPQPNPRSILKRHIFTEEQPSSPKFKRTLLVNRSLLLTNQQMIYNMDNPDSEEVIEETTATSEEELTHMSIKSPRDGEPKVKYRDKNHYQNREVMLEKRMKLLKQKFRKNSNRIINIDMSSNAMKRKRKYNLHNHNNKSNSHGRNGENFTINHDEEQQNNVVAVQSGRPQLDPVISGEILKVHKVESDSDLEIDIESNDGSNNESSSNARTAPPPPIEPTSDYDAFKTIKREDETDSDNISQNDLIVKSEYDKFYDNLTDKFDNDEKRRHFFEQLESMDEPADEQTLNKNEITDLERCFHFEFFEGRPTKTPERYMKIRGHILSSWRNSKPSYVSKTAVRGGLKHCGDVKCISRIHCLLEQIGAINFGCAGKNFDYVRPLSQLVETFAQATKKTDSCNNRYSMKMMNGERRQRKRSNTINSDIMEDANFTITHLEDVHIPQFIPDPSKMRNNTTTHNRQPFERHYNKKVGARRELELVKCLRFSKDNLAPFKVTISLSTLLCLQLHSLSSNHEVMGFLGGHRSKSVGRNKLSLTRYKPCKTSAQSGTMCEMCPVSQVEQSASLLSEGYDLLGWFHSHPKFPPNPSRTDVGTQAEMQLQFSLSDVPFIGFIMSCIGMQFKCVYIIPKDLHSTSCTDGLPYELDVEVVKDYTNVEQYIREVLDVIEREDGDPRFSETVKKFFSSANSLLLQFNIPISIEVILNNFNL